MWLAVLRLRVRVQLLKINSSCGCLLLSTNDGSMGSLRQKIRYVAHRVSDFWGYTGICSVA